MRAAAIIIFILVIAATGIHGGTRNAWMGVSPFCLSTNVLQIFHFTPWYLLYFAPQACTNVGQKCEGNHPNLICVAGNPGPYCIVSVIQGAWSKSKPEFSSMHLIFNETINFIGGSIGPLWRIEAAAFPANLTTMDMTLEPTFLSSKFQYGHKFKGETNHTY